MFIRTDDKVNLFYTCSGDPEKPALLFSNSLGTTRQMWQSQLDALSKYFYIIRYDSRGHGLSDKPVGPYSVTRLGQDALCILGALGIRQACFCGISMGGLIGLWLAIYAPERFKKIVVANTAAKIGNSDAWLARAALVRREGLTTIAATAAGRWFTSNFIKKQPELIELLLHTLKVSDAEGYAACCEALADADLHTQLHRIKLPLLVIASTADPVTTVLDSQIICETCNHAILVKLNASHISNIEQAAAFNKALVQFLR